MGSGKRKNGNQAHTPGRPRKRMAKGRRSNPSTIVSGVITATNSSARRSNQKGNVRNTPRPNGSLNYISPRPTYKEMAPKVGLDVDKCGDDIPTIQVHEVRLPDDVFWDILQDILAVNYRYGGKYFLANERSRSRCISAYFERLASLFEGALLINPEVHFDSGNRVAWIENRFTINGATTLLFIEVQNKPQSIQEELELFGQIIAQCFVHTSKNSQEGLVLSITGIITDGEQFQVFEFSNPEDGGEVGQAKFSLGKFCNNSQRIVISTGSSRWDSAESFNTQDAVFQVRSVCQTLFHDFLKAYSYGLEAHVTRFDKRREEACARTEKEIQWRIASSLSRCALVQGVTSWTQWNNYKNGSAGLSLWDYGAKNALRWLSER